MNQKIFKFASLLFFLMLLSSVLIFAEGEKKKQVGKIEGSPAYTHFNINNISTWIKNDGESDINPNGNSGLQFPKGSGKTAVFQTGFVYGGIVNGEVRVGGSTYRQGQTPGKILPDGSAQDPNDPDVRIWRVRKDWNESSAVFTSEIADGDGSTDADVKAKYEYDWINWPWQSGAPYEDVNNNGQYDYEVDIPGEPGAAQSIWFVVNDLDAAQCQFLYGSNPIGLEMRASIWGYTSSQALQNMFFRKYTLINRSANTVDSMYVCLWSDPDVGDAGDDFVGCDVDKSLAYAYNGLARDGQYGSYPPAAGWDFFQGPIVPAPGQTAIVNNQYLADYENLSMSTMFFFINGDPIYADPDLGYYTTGTLQMWNLFRGRVSTTGEPFIDPTTGMSTKYCLSGDPVTGEGWVDGIAHPPGDRRLGLVSGPFTMAPGDTQEIVLSEILAGATQGTNNIAAIQFLRYYDLIAQQSYDNFFLIPESPTPPVVNISTLDQEIVLNWGTNAGNWSQTESKVNQGYKFQGYNVYQLPTRSATQEEAIRIATYDVIDDITVITQNEPDMESGLLLEKAKQFGTNSGVKRFITINKDYINNTDLINGTKYYFAVTAYSYNDDPSVAVKTLESKFNVYEIIPQAEDAGTRYQASTNEELIITHIGTADASVEVKVVDPSKLTGHDYEVSFFEQNYYLDKNNVWKKTNYPDSIGKSGYNPEDASASTLSGLAVYQTYGDNVDCRFTLDLVSPDYDYCDGIQVTFPTSITVLKAEPTVGNTYGHTIPPVVSGNTVTWGGDYQSGDGEFSGGEEFVVTIAEPTLPISINYEIFDDGWGFLSGYDTTYGIINAIGSLTISEMGHTFSTQTHWRLRDVTDNIVVLDDQKVFWGEHLYWNYDGQWNSKEVGEDYTSIVYGLKVNVTSGSFEAPVTIGSVSLLESGATKSSTVPISTTGDGSYAITDYLYYGWAATGKSIDAFGNGVDVIDILQKDYELRFTGVYDTLDNAGQQIIDVRRGTGSYATLYNTRSMSMGDHPLNPTPGSSDPFLIRIPFEVWNKDDNRQVNLIMLDRKQTATADPFYPFNITNRMYCEILNTAYDSTLVNSGDPGETDTDSLTWNLVFWTTYWNYGDVITLQYSNPIQYDKDKFTFTTAAPTFSTETQEEDLDRINVYPNPYYGANPREINKYQRFVTINHLPVGEHALIKIYNLAGQLVKRLWKLTGDPQEIKWDLNNEDGLPVASGLFLIHVEIPDLGFEKILKVGIIQEQQVLDRF
ncbi:MAG: hypothetical protein JXA68_11050 [Ignavibacteriales bacterium]|nr:hypothetical protein [Ignavibacteriales bacterium]